MITWILQTWWECSWHLFHGRRSYRANRQKGLWGIWRGYRWVSAGPSGLHCLCCIWGKITAKINILLSNLLYYIMLIQIITMTSYTNLPLHSIWQSTEALYLTLTVKLFSPVLFVIGFFAGNSWNKTKIEWFKPKRMKFSWSEWNRYYRQTVLWCMQYCLPHNESYIHHKW